ncbi:hypothetical protein ACIRBX_37145 [Kitasatospora sp. NPDC096147]|uniref:hypothetical protein n=1 Tax=Kitasatospora sp. NPDC096147 TaxID=3364093 RepID=UPI003808FB18
MRTTRVFDVANRLARAAGARARVSLRDEGGYRVYVILPRDIGAEAQLAVLDVLVTADRFGHDKAETVEGVWAEIDPEPEERA